ncbi:MAG: hypothetical protein GC162_06355 [Planctomycetes bacterium]|nr:hypothetical protein [Planctomycetota bacterium]
MGWFLGSKPQKKKKPAAKKSTGKREPWDPAKTLRAVRAGVWVVLVGGAAIGWVLGQKALKQHIAATKATMPIVDLHDAPVWMPPTVADHLRSIVASGVEPDPFDQASLANVVGDLQESAWVEHVQRVQRLPGGRIEVIASYRRPVALIESGDGYHLVDGRGVLLPLTYPADKAAMLGLPMIRGVQHAPPLPGDTWAGGDVRAGLRLGLLAYAEPWANQVRSIDVTNYGGRIDRSAPQLLIATRHGLVRWGRGIGEEQFYEPPASTKLAHVDLIMRKFHTIDAGGQVVDVFGDSVVTHPIAEAPELRYTSAQ